MTKRNPNNSLSKTTNLIMLVFAAIGVLATLSCMDKKPLVSPPGYNLNSPVKYNMPDELLEISGITFRNNKSDVLYAEEDENGRVYYFKLGDKNIQHTTFAKAGDYEDLAIFGEQVTVLRSDGVLFTFPFTELKNAEAGSVQKQKDLLPEGEYEGMYADNKAALLYVLCKQCADENASKMDGVYIFKQGADGTLKQSGQVGIDVKGIERLSGIKKFSFKPSAFAKNQSTGEWYLLSSINKMIVVTDANFKAKAVYPLNRSVFVQPEGIAFDEQNNLYISNEGDKITPGTVLKFNYKK